MHFVRSIRQIDINVGEWMLNISDDIEMLSTLSQIDIGKLDNDWKSASEEENTLIKA